MSGSRSCRTRLNLLSTFPFLGLFCFFMSFSFFKQVSAGKPIEKAILSAYGSQNPKALEFFCIPYNPEFYELPTNQKSAKFHPLMDFTPDTGCTDIYKNVNITNTIVAVARGDCNFSLKAALILQNGGIGVLNVSPDNQSQIIPGGNESDYNNINITVALIQEKDFLSIKKLGDDIMVKLFSPQPSLFDITEFVIFLLAMTSIIIGSYWSGVSFFQQTNLKKIDKQQKTDSQRDESNEVGRHKPLEEEPKTETPDEKRSAKTVFPVSIPVVIMMMCVMSAFLLGLYFLYDYLVYVVIFMFTVTSSVAFYTCFKGIWSMLIPGEQRLQFLCMRCCHFDMRYKDIIFAMISISVGLVWFVYRHASFSWILQDFLGVLFCIHVLKNIRIPSLKAGGIFLCLAFLYDIFFVFITPFFTKDGSSVMVDVATGGRSHHQNEQESINNVPRSVPNSDPKTNANPTRGDVEILPLVFRVPHFLSSLLSVCFAQESLLGFGDIILPGVLIVYNHIFDIYARTRKLYFILSVLAYFLGLVLAFVALSITKVGQPALLYLVPCVLLSTVIPACIRKEFKVMWSGSFLVSPSSENVPDLESGTKEILENNDETSEQQSQPPSTSPQEESNSGPQTNPPNGKEDDHLLAS